MRKFLIFSGIAVVIIIGLMIFMNDLHLKQEKSLSPEEQASFEKDDLTVSVTYNRPYKKGRDIFGALVPFDKVWRTGANEATVFRTNRDLLFNGNILKAGTYTLWTIPGQNHWTVIFNSQYGQWGINSSGEPNRDPQRDVLTIEAWAVQKDKTFEQFTISFQTVGEEIEMTLMWESTVVAVPFTFVKK